MAILPGISQTFSAYVTPRKPALQQRYPTPDASDTLEQPLDEEPLSPLTRTKDWLESSANDDLEALEGDTLLEDAQRPGKRPPSSGHIEKRSVKRRKSNEGYHPGEDDKDSDFEGETLLTSTPGPENQTQSEHKVREDRRAMPPPAKPAIRIDDLPYIPDKNTIDRNLQNNIIRKESVLSHESVIPEEEIFTKKTAVRREDRSEVNPQFEFDRALRHAIAQELPADSGIWSETEKDMFYRLAMRGFEPLVPGHWTMDFKTLPHQLFAFGEQEPLISPFAQREFRAKHYLRTLFSIAANVRDRRLASLRPEPTIKRTLRQYISWSLHDAGVHPMQRPRVIPVHAIATLRQGEESQHVIKRMSKKLYKLARRYQDVYRVQQSVEPQHPDPLPTPLDSREKASSSASEYDDAHMPTLIGLMIASSVVAVVTLDSRSSPPTSPPAHENTAEKRHSRSSSSKEDAIATVKDESGLRFIANFDFSTHDGYDVWDGFAMAICIMRIRKTMLELCGLAEREGEAESGGMWEQARPKSVSPGKSGLAGFDYGNLRPENAIHDQAKMTGFDHDRARSKSASPSQRAMTGFDYEKILLQPR
jgi:hypothetical protein